MEMESHGNRELAHMKVAAAYGRNSHLEDPVEGIGIPFEKGRMQIKDFSY